MARRKGLNGGLLVNKPPGPTSHDIVKAVRRTLKTKKVGHTGTLDPFADGLLVLLVGPATRLAEFMSGYDKTYRATALLGLMTDTDDATGKVLEEKTVPEFSREDVETVLGRFKGEITQKVPAFSAVKVRGERLYSRARKGAVLEAPSRPVTISSIELVNWEPPLITFWIRCSAGTYVRALARDLGESLGCGAHLTALTRLAVGPYELEGAVTPDEVNGAESLRREGAFIPAAQLLPDLPTVEVAPEYVSDIKNGKSVPRPEVGPADASLVKLIAAGNMVAVGRVAGRWIKPVKVLTLEDDDARSD